MRRARLCSVVAATAAAVSSVAPAAAPAQTSTRTHVYTAIADASVRADRPSRNDGLARRLAVGRGRVAYVRFDVSIPAGERIVSARLVLSPQRKVQVRRTSNNWHERHITWRHRPKAARVLRSLQRTGTFTYALTSRSRRALRFASRESGKGPRLVFTTAPTGSSSPSGGSGGGSQPQPGQTAPAAPDPSQPAPVPGGPADPSGEGPPHDLPGWKQVFVDDFAADVALGRFSGVMGPNWWAYKTGWPDSSGRGVYDSGRTLSVRGGLLNWFVHTENGVHYTSAIAPRFPGSSGGVTSVPSGQLYGRYSVRFRSDRLPGYKIAWLLWPDSKNFPNDGEIDFPEADLDSSTISGYVHHQGATAGHDQDTFKVAALLTGWHTATIEWLPGRVTFYLDARKVGTTANRVPNTPMHWVLQTETNTWGWPVPDASQGNVQVDWVAAWRPAG
jgi:hypothetical protein